MNNYNSMQIGLQTNGALPQRSKPQRPTSRQETPTKVSTAVEVPRTKGEISKALVFQVIPGSVDIPSADGSMNSAMKYLDTQFSTLDFNSADNFDNTTAGTDQSAVSALSNKYTQSASAPPHSELPSITSFQASQQPKPTLPATNISSVLNQTNKVRAESV